MRVIALVLLASCVLGTAVSADAEESACNCATEVADVSSLTAALAAKEQQASELQHQIDRLQGELSTAFSKQSKAESALSDAESRLQGVQGDLTSTQSKLRTAETMLADAQKELSKAEQASKGTVESCKRTLEKVQSDLSEQAAKLAELQALEHALLPAWLARSIATTSVFVNSKLYELQESDLYGRAVGIYGQAAEQLTPYWEKVLTALEPVRASLSKLPIEATLNSAKQQIANIEYELHVVVKQFISSQPSLSSLNDPVTIQLVVYSILGFPMVLLSLLLISVAASPSKKDKGSAGKLSAGRPTASKPAPSANRPAGKGKKGKAIRDGGDVLYTA
jgi:myosin heavy subunit